MPRKLRTVDDQGAFVQGGDAQSDAERLQAFRRRQEADLARFDNTSGLHQRQSLGAGDSDAVAELEDEKQQNARVSQRPQWRNAEGHTLGDFGVDEAAEVPNGDSVPLSRLLDKARSERST